MATLYIGHHLPRTSHQPLVQGLSIDDVAMDCIASLFERNSDGSFRWLTSYYQKKNWQTLNEEELLCYTRRLIFSRVHQELCRIWKQGDPSLERLARNLRYAVDRSKHLRICNEFGAPWISTKRRPVDHDHPHMSPEYLEAHLTPQLRAHMKMFQVAEALTRVFQEQGTYARSFPLIGAALVVRQAFTKLNVEQVPSPISVPSTPLDEEEMSTILKRSIAAIDSRMQSSYVSSGKIGSAIYSSYLRVVRDILYDEFVMGDGHEKGLFDYLAANVPGLTRIEYTRQHRVRLEYLVRISRSALLSQLRKEF